MPIINLSPTTTQAFNMLSDMIAKKKLLNYCGIDAKSLIRDTISSSSTTTTFEMRERQQSRSKFQ